MNPYATIRGTDIFFKFIEISSDDSAGKKDLIRQIKEEKLHGFVTKGLLTSSEVHDVNTALNSLPERLLMPTPSGSIFPDPFATMSDEGEMLDKYYDKLYHLHELKKEQPAIKLILDKLDAHIKSCAEGFEVSVPVNKVKKKMVSPGTFRFFKPGYGGLHVHCGNLFQQQSLFYYSLLEEDVNMDGQLSYFIVLQKPEGGGELTIYDMLWNDVKDKDHPEENNYVLDKNGNKIYLDQLRQFTVNPEPGDILIFSGGPIWHRVEDIKGSHPRVTLGGFLNFSKDGKGLYYWS